MVLDTVASKTTLLSIDLRLGNLGKKIYLSCSSSAASNMTPPVWSSYGYGSVPHPDRPDVVLNSELTSRTAEVDEITQPRQTFRIASDSFHKSSRIGMRTRSSSTWGCK